MREAMKPEKESHPRASASIRGSSSYQLSDAYAAIPPRLLFLVGAAIAVAYLSTIGWFPMSEPDEARYAEIPREMLARGDWITPYLNHVKYFEKPPLLYWLVAGSYAVFGFHELCARLWPVLFAFVGMAVTYGLGASMWNARTGAVAVALLASSPLYFGLSQVLSLDMPLAALLLVAVGAFWIAYTHPPRRRAAVALFYAAMALAVLTKGPVSVLLVVGLVAAFVILRWEWSILGWLLSPSGLLLFVAIALPWHLAVGLRNPEFAEFYVVDQHLKRYLSPHEHQEPLWFYVPVILGGAAPWVLLCLCLPAAWRPPLLALLRRQAPPATLYTVLWAVVVFVFFSLSGSKLATYVLPLFPALALLMARGLDVGLERYPRSLRRAAMVVTCIGVLLIVAAFVVGEVVDDPNGPTIVSRLLLSGSLILVVGAAAVYFARKGDALSSLAGLVVAMLCFQLVAISGRNLARSYKELGLTIAQHASREDLVVSYGHFTQGIPLYSGRRTVLVGTRSELDFGSRQGDHARYFWAGDDEVVQHWASGEHLFLVINRVELEKLRPRLLPPPHELAGEGKKVVVVNFDT